MESKIVDTLDLCARELRAVGKYVGVANARLRIHPDAPGGAGVQVEYEDGTSVWLVAEE